MDTGQLRCGSGISLGTILQTLVPRGWFLPVVPGTRFVSVGGAIASDVHGKNHHRDGSFCDHVLSLRLLLASGEILDCSPTENAEIFHASCAGMGLTGIILDATLQLLPVTGNQIRQQTHKATSLEHSFELIEAQDGAQYSVAWLDCLATGEQLGRSILFTGEHESGTETAPRNRNGSGLQIPFNLPSFCLNRFSIGAFNSVYYAQNKAGESLIDYQKYFFPLDSIGHWNRLYGKRGFIQYQFVMPETSALSGIRQVLQKVSAEGKGSFLSVLKKLGPANNNLLSFPTAGYTLALDFKFEKSLPALLNQLDDIVLDHGGRLYLAKDARMSSQVFKKSYPRWEEFAAIREKIGAKTVFNSLQSARLGL